MTPKPTTKHQPDRTNTELPTDTDTTLRLSYRNETGNAIIIRTYQNHADFVREVDTEWMYNYVSEQWEHIHRFILEHDLADDGETLAGDGSNWRGTNRNWRNWFTQRHYERLQIRFPNDETPESRDEHDSIPNPANTTVEPAP